MVKVFYKNFDERGDKNMTIVQEVSGLLGLVAQFVGLLVFGFAAAWFTLHAYRFPERPWQLQAVIYFAFLGLAALLAHWATPGGLGAFGLGAGAGLLFWGLRKSKGEEESTKD
jgi:hypothetical protein